MQNKKCNKIKNVKCNKIKNVMQNSEILITIPRAQNHKIHQNPKHPYFQLYTDMDQQSNLTLHD